MLIPLVRTLRPHQWVKNLFVAAPLIFARRLQDPAAFKSTAVAVATFCALSSAVYLFNDIKDIDKDRAHPTKRNRPIASGALSIAAARHASALLALGGLLVASLVRWDFLAIAVGYLLNNLAYTTRLKRVAFLDVGSITLGFLLRVLGGAAAIPVEPSIWLLTCTLLLASLLGFGKRAHELRLAGPEGGTRDVLGRYSPTVLRGLLVALSLGTVLTYLAYTLSEHAHEFLGTRHLVFTVPFVAFGIARFFLLATRSDRPQSPTDAMLRDLPFLLNLALYAATVFVVLYRHP